MPTNDNIDGLRAGLIKNKQELSRLQAEKADALQEVSLHNRALAKAKKQKAATGRTEPTPEIKEAEKHIRQNAQKAIDLSAAIARLEKQAADLELAILQAKQQKRAGKAAEDAGAAGILPTLQAAPPTPPTPPPAPPPSVPVREAADKVTLLFMAANAVKSVPLDIDNEAREIQESISKSARRDCLNFVTRWAVQPLDILQAINETDPQIIHLSGHGLENDQIVLQGDDGKPKPVSLSAIVQVIMTVAATARLVFFNMCCTEDEAQAVVKYVDAAIGMRTEIGDKAARIFAAQFYSTLCFGKSLKVAFEQAKAALMLEGIKEEDTPMLFVREGLDSDEIILVKDCGSGK